MLLRSFPESVHQIYAAGDLADPHGTHGVCLDAILRVKFLKIQKSAYCSAEKELSKAEYLRLIKAAKETGKIVTVEEHSIIGGLGSAVCDVLCENYPVPVTKIGVMDTFGHSGPAAALLEEFGLCADNIANTVKKVLGK